ncbi:sensor histidine kinase [Promicromonospora sp. MS192]|uniref:sensor histidine kinase n=1 Tax=Promicromonospora sp. MS192 TaxID=3412684 RepID=UPI003C2D4AEA
MTHEPWTRDVEHSPAHLPVRRLALLVAAAAFAALLVLAGVSPWWMVPLAAVAALLGLLRGGGRLGVVAMAVGAAAGAGAVLAGWADLRDALVATARGVVTGVLPWAVALAWRARRNAEADAALALVREQDTERLRAETDLARQRLQLAESLHDDLGHALSLVAVNLGRLELELERGTSAPRPSGAAGPATSVQESVSLARRQVSDAVARLGASVQTLRTGRADARPSPGGQADVEALVQEARRAGADVVLTAPPGDDLVSAYGPAVTRVVREGLTNALRHAPGRPVRVTLVPRASQASPAPGEPEAAARRLVVTVSNPLPPSTGPVERDHERAASDGGTGLRSLAEQVRRTGGSFEAGPRSGAYVLTAELHPVPEGRSSGGVPEDGARPTGHEPSPRARSPRDARAVTDGLARARRRGGALLLAAVLVPSAALVAVATAIQLADNLDARRAMLGPAAFARIDVGDARADVQPLLPGTTLDPPPGADPACDYYAVTADPLDDASGDAYRICWAEHHVTSADVVVGVAR